MKTVVCKECGYSIEKKDPGKYYCENCGKIKKFFIIEAFCGSKPNNELYEHN
jgi:anaerobic ribonucleoside-triphosphate reductase